jgi:sterol desaturase/sphingolipid hydroxylase (fatty acid hydroxylase superfamily)
VGYEKGAGTQPQDLFVDEYGRSEHLAFLFMFSRQTVGDLGPLEYILSTPTQHAIHHGRNRFCIDMNYGGFLSIWDHLFSKQFSTFGIC